MCLDDYRLLTKTLKTPPMFTDVLPLIVKHDEIEMLLQLSQKEQSAVELSDLLQCSKNLVDTKIDSLFKRGFLKKKKGANMTYSVKSFPKIVGRYLSGGRTESLGKYAVALASYSLDDHVKQGKADPYPEGKVLPVPQAILEPASIVLPYETALNILERARSFSLRNCECRMTYKNCAKPLRTCLGLNEFSDELVERGVAEKISLEEAKEVLHLANQHGIVHQALYTDWIRGEVFDICSCCACCCQYLRTLLDCEVKHHVAKSGLQAKVDLEKCNGCGTCINRCIFHARKLENGKSIVIKDRCYGCGLCSATCPTGATKLGSMSTTV